MPHAVGRATRRVRVAARASGFLGGRKNLFHFMKLRAQGPSAIPAAMKSFHCVAPVLFVFALPLGVGCGTAEDDEADASPEGAWVLESTDAVCGSGVTGGPSPVDSATFEIDMDTITIDVSPCFGRMTGSWTEGETGFVATLVNDFQEDASMTCFSEGPNAYRCEHSWLDGDLQMQRL